MSEFKPTKEQQNAIDAKGSVLVSAAAGSGKTAVLSQRVIQRITGDNALDADRLLIVTFTNAAADEMRSRINRKMSDEIRKNPFDKRLQRQQLLLSKAQITTIDSFCIKLVRDNFHSLNMPADFKPSDGGRLAKLREAALAETLEEYYLAGDAVFEKMLLAFGDCDSDSFTCAAINDTYDFLSSLPFPKQWIDFVLSQYKKEDISETVWFEYLIKASLETVNMRISELETLREFALQNGEDKKTEIINEKYEDFRVIREALISGEYKNIRSMVKLAGSSKPTYSKKTADPCFLAAFNDTMAKCKVSSDKLKRRFDSSEEDCLEDLKKLRPVMEKFFEVIMRFVEIFNKKKAENSAYGFSDIERKALELLAKFENGEIIPTERASEISGRYDEVMVDEYQDTNDLQDTIFRIISDGGKKLFAVGDAKQSIYRFRQANPENFIKMIEEYPDYDGASDPSKIVLSKNFRSRSGICDFANFLFSSIMSKRCGDIEYNESQRLNAAASYPERGEPDVHAEILDVSEIGEDTAAAYKIAEIVHDMTSRECITDESGNLRRAKLSDFAVICRTRTRFSGIIDELSKAGIAAVPDEDIALCETKEVLWALSVFKTVCNPLLDVDFLSAMLSPMFGFSADEAVEIRLCDRYAPLFECTKKAANLGNAKAEKMIDAITGLRRDIISMPLDAFVRKLCETTGFSAFVSAMPKGAAKKANLTALAEAAAEFEAFGGDPYSFAAYIEGSSKIKAQSFAEEDGEAVKLTTVHHSKGLEVPVVIIPSLESPFNKSDQTDRLVLNRHLGVGLRVTERERLLSYSPFCREAIASKTEEEAKSEAIRLLYVAVTRARESLYLLFSSKKPEDAVRKYAARLKSSAVLQNGDVKINPVCVKEASSYADMILPVLLTHPCLKSEAVKYGAGIFTKNCGEKMDFSIVTPEFTEFDKTEEKADKTDFALANEMINRMNYRYPFKELNRVASKYSVTGIVSKGSESDYYYTSRPRFMSAKGLTPSERGTAMHMFLEVCDFDLAKKNLEEEISRLANGGFISKKQADSIDTERLKAFFESEVFRRISNADEVYRELRFMSELKAKRIDPSLPDSCGDETVVIQGIADCVTVENRLAVIIDYKTDRVKSVNELRERYGEQLRIYAEAISESLKLPVCRCEIYSLYLSESTEITII
ncbi:MAG: helicase-exonuclease AddAB subunit AddA [Acutalibacteraceae bacterium]